MPADAHLDAPARGRVLRSGLGHPGHRAQAVYDLLGAPQRVHHARAHGLCLEPQWLTHGQPLRLVYMAPLRVSCAAGRRASTPRCAGRGRLLPGRLGQMCAAAGLELGIPMCPHTHRARRGRLPGCYRCASPHQPSLSDAAPRTVHSHLTRPARHPCAGFCALALQTCRAGWPAAWHDARGCLWRRRRLRGGGGRAWAGPAVATGHAAASRAAGTHLSRRCGCARARNSASVPY